MENNKPKISCEANHLTIDDQSYDYVDSPIDGLMRNSATDAIVLIKKYKDDETRKIYDYKRNIISFFYKNKRYDEIDEIVKKTETQYFNEFDTSEHRNMFIIPYMQLEIGRGDKKEMITLSNVPHDFDKKYVSIDKAIQLVNFPLHMRVVAIGKIIDICNEIQRNLLGLVRHIDPRSVLVNVENGDVKVILEECIDGKIANSRKLTGGYLFLNNGRDPISEQMLNEYVAYSIFRLICVENPFDGKKSLVDFPLLSSKASFELNRRDYNFAVLNSDNTYSEYFGKEIFNRWNSLPMFLRQILEQYLSNTQNSGQEKHIIDWEYTYRQVRDCLVFVNGQFKFCDPNENNRVNFLEIGNYKIPIWFRKALYRYHIDDSSDISNKNDVIIGVNAEGLLENRTNEPWVVEFQNVISYIKPSQVFSPEVGMQIKINEANIKIVSGTK